MLQRSSAAAENSMLSFANSVSTIHPKESEIRGSGEFSAASPSVEAENRSWLNGLTVLSPQRPISSRSGREHVTFSEDLHSSKVPKKSRSSRDYSTLTGRRVTEASQGLKRNAAWTEKTEAARSLVTHPSRSLTSAPRETPSIPLRRSRAQGLSHPTPSAALPPRYPIPTKTISARPSSAPPRSSIRTAARSKVSAR